MLKIKAIVSDKIAFKGPERAFRDYKPFRWTQDREFREYTQAWEKSSRALLHHADEAFLQDSTRTFLLLKRYANALIGNAFIDKPAVDGPDCPFDHEKK